MADHSQRMSEQNVSNAPGPGEPNPDAGTLVRLLTIGHSNSALTSLLTLLSEFHVQTIVDVRSVPYSRYAPQFNRELLEASLADAGINYRWAGEYLGGRPSDPTCYWSRTLPKGKADYLELVNYAEVAKRDWFVRGLTRLVQLARGHVTAALCSEEDPSRCHRHRLIARTLVSQGVEVKHIRATRTLEDPRTTEQRIADLGGTGQLGLFATRDLG